MEFIGQIKETLRGLDVHLFTVGKTEITLWSVLSVLIGICVLFVVAGWLKGWVANRLLGHSRLDVGTRHAIGTITRYVVLIAGFMVIMQTAGINLSTFNVLAGAVGVGVGFGLQDIVKNFISGLIIMFDRPIHVGDRIEIAGVNGQVVDIGARRITMTTPEGVTIVVPNSKFVTDSVRNMHGVESPMPLKLTVNVSRDSDPKLVRRLLEEAAAANPRISRDHVPFARLNMPTAGAFPFELQVWGVGVEGRERDELLNELHYALHEKLSAAGVKLV